MPFTSQDAAPPSPVAPPPRYLKRKPLAPRAAKRRAQHLLGTQRLSPLALATLDALAVAGVLTDTQLMSLVGGSERTLRRYYKQHLLDRLPATKMLEARGLVYRQVYGLGQVGLEIARLRQPGLVPTGYGGYGAQRIAHDLFCNQVVLGLLEAGQRQGGGVTWRSKYEATVHDGEGRPQLEPDALVGWQELGGRERLWLVEYHNEDNRRRVKRKLEGYERIRQAGRWQMAWETEEFPAILVVWTYGVVGEEYRFQLGRGLSGGVSHYLGKPWQSVVEDDAPEWWLDLQTNEVVNLFEG